MERVLSFLVQANFEGHFFPFFAKAMKRGLNGEKRFGKDLERGRKAVLGLSRSSNLARFRFDSLLKPVLDPFLSPFKVFLVVHTYHI